MSHTSSFDGLAISIAVSMHTRERVTATPLSNTDSCETNGNVGTPYSTAPTNDLIINFMHAQAQQTEPLPHARHTTLNTKNRSNAYKLCEVMMATELSRGPFPRFCVLHTAEHRELSEVLLGSGES